MLYSWYSLYITFNVHNMLYMFCCCGKACICCYILIFTVRLLPQSSPLTSEYYLQLLWADYQMCVGVTSSSFYRGLTTRTRVHLALTSSLYECVFVCVRMRTRVYVCEHSFVLLRVFAWVWNQFSTPLSSVRLVEETDHIILNRPTSRGSMSHRGHGCRGYVSVKKMHFQFLTSQKMLYKSIDMWVRPSCCDWPEIRSGQRQQRCELIT